MSKTDLLTAWQNDHADPAVAARVAEAHAVWATPAPCEVSRGMVVDGTPADVVAAYTGTVTLPVCSFTARDWIADEFANLNDRVPAGRVRVKLFAPAGTATVPVHADDSFEFEGEHLVAGTFTAEAVYDTDGDVVVVELAGVK